ncbi:hypothetical protein PsAD2_03169 [Pseudovibrio axinellae]|uniref:Uncharacterized protein n=1 Tax=Pseudovibrio axinellae TaxID=989403 RepID=A0A165X352_9HYPH|nr:hypothetical protein PsAD2_03169 [Pseudovibrio axinellae]SEQ19339.1 hypothetical protein SAMN05421798_10298 [Pseudovibrio axinellae]
MRVFDIWLWDGLTESILEQIVNIEREFAELPRGLEGRLPLIVQLASVPTSAQTL